MNRSGFSVRTALLVAGAISFAVSAARAEEFLIVGPRAMGMGGAGVATTRGGLSSYWNPAALAPPKTPRVDYFFDLNLHASAELAATDDSLSVIDNLSEQVENIDFDSIEDAFNNGTVNTDQIEDILQVADSISQLNGTGLIANAAPGLHLRFGQFGLSATGFIRAGGLALVDTTTLALGDEGLDSVFDGGATPTTAAGQELANRLTGQLTDLGVADPAAVANDIAAQVENAGVADFNDPRFTQLLDDIIEATVDATGGGGNADEFFTQNGTGVAVRGVAMQEYALSYAHDFLSLFSVGAAVKVMNARTTFSSFTLNNLDGFDDLAEELERGLEQDDFGFAVDLGVLVMPTDWLSVGIVGKYLNSPTFDFQGPGDYRIDPQVRIGAAVEPFDGFTIAADLDLFSNSSQTLIGYDSQHFGGGIEYNLFDILFLRGGISKNLAESGQDPTIHAGLGLRVFGVALDLAGAMATDFAEIPLSDGDTEEVPERVGASLMLSIAVPLQ
ncbi:MAG: hypothetical protein AAF517_03960 [Planctomycetota bacterium]